MWTASSTWLKKSVYDFSFFWLVTVIPQLPKQALCGRNSLISLPRLCKNIANYSKFHQLFDLGVEDQGQINYVIMVHHTSSNGHAPIQQISLIYLERQKKKYGPDKFCQLFDLGVYGKGQMISMMVGDTRSYRYAPTYQYHRPILKGK